MTAICTNAVSIPTKSKPYNVASTLRLVTRMLETRTQRSTLAQLDTARLEDMGLSFDQVSGEVKRPFWDVPAHWKL